MPRRQIALLAVLGTAFVVFVALAAKSEYWSVGDVLGLAGFGIVFVVVAFMTLVARGQQPVEGHRGMPRSFWVVFASFAAAFAIAMLLAVLAVPWVGYKGFEVLLGPDYWWVLPVLAAVAFPFVRRRLL